MCHGFLNFRFKLRPNKKICLFQVTCNFKIGKVGWKIYLFYQKFLYEVNRKTIWPNREIPQKTLKKNFSVGSEKLGTVG